MPIAYKLIDEECQHRARSFTAELGLLISILEGAKNDVDGDWRELRRVESLLRTERLDALADEAKSALGSCKKYLAWRGLKLLPSGKIVEGKKNEA